MKVLVLNNRARLSTIHYVRWLGPGADEVFLITDKIAVTDDFDGAGFAYASVLSDYAGNPLVEMDALALARERGVDAVVALSERDILRAARIRERLGISGQHEDSAIAYRDKLVMKDALRAAGVTIADYRPIRHVDDVVAAADAFGYPFVIKPRHEVSSEGVIIVQSPDALRDSIAACRTLRGDADPALLAEAYVPHELYLVDGIVVDGKLAWCWASWMSSMLGHRHGEPLTSAILDPDDPLLGRLRAMAEQAIGALPPLDLSIIHIEVFVRPDGTLVFNEIASRVGGARIDTMLEASFGIGPVEAYLQSVGSGSVVLPPAQPTCCAAFAFIRPRPGILEAIPRECDLPDIYLYEAIARAGSELSAPANGVAAIAAVVTTGESRKDAEAALGTALTWIGERLIVTDRP